MKTTIYVAVDVGCIECGEPSRVIGAFVRLKDAESAMKQAEDEQAKAWRGQHDFFVEEVTLDLSGED